MDNGRNNIQVGRMELRRIDPDDCLRLPGVQSGVSRPARHSEKNRKLGSVGGNQRIGADSKSFVSMVGNVAPMGSLDGFGARIFNSKSRVESGVN